MRCGLTEQRQIEMAHGLMMPAHRKKQTEYLEKIRGRRDHSRIQVSAARGVGISDSWISTSARQPMARAVQPV